MSEIVISAVHVKKTYRRYRNNFQKISHMLFLSNAGEKVRILKDISFDIRKGEKVGILAAPGAGKSTIMRILADIIKPESGEVTVNGEITTLFSHRLGFENALTGRDNYEIRASLQGWSKEKMKENAAEVFDFAGIVEEEIDAPIKEYKKGQPSMLGFGISTVDKPEIFLLDDRITFGGKTNNQKAVKRLKKLVEGSDTTFVMAVDDVRIAEQLCERGIVINRGKVIFDGPFEEAVESYSENCNVQVKRSKKKKSEKKGSKKDKTAKKEKNDKKETIETNHREDN